MAVPLSDDDPPVPFQILDHDHYSVGIESLGLYFV